MALDRHGGVDLAATVGRSQEIPAHQAKWAAGGECQLLLRGIQHDDLEFDAAPGEVAGHPCAAARVQAPTFELENLKGNRRPPGDGAGLGEELEDFLGRAWNGHLAARPAPVSMWLHAATVAGHSQPRIGEIAGRDPFS